MRDIDFRLEVLNPAGILDVVYFRQKSDFTIA
jgi:hypothetical protein